ncbi:MAG TPA: DUF4401 domain-containing protein [Vicinamibacterales bacterium]|nr:DUF4401 domain-containing protein [Vicinamibacterales bacterium]
MNTGTRADLWQRLADEGLVQGEVPAAAEPAAPWYVRAMLGVAGWIGALFLLGFVGAGLAFVFRDEGAALVVGALCCGAAALIFNKMGRNVLAAQFGLAVSFAGQAMFIYGLHEAGGFDDNSGAFFLCVAVFEGALAFFLGNFVHRVWSAFAAATAFGYALPQMGIYGVSSAATGAAVAAIWLDRSKWAVGGSFWRAIGWGLVLAFVRPDAIFYGLLRMGSTHAPIVPISWIPWVATILTAGVLLYVVYRLLEQHGEAPGGQVGMTSFAAAAAICAVTYKAAGIPEALVVVLLGFAAGSRALFGLGILALLWYISYFYYSLEATLLVKSFALAGAGLVMIVLRAAMPAVLGAATDARRTDA